MQIFLNGFMGSGKSFTAIALSQLLDMPFIDLDEYIEKKGGQSIATLFKFGGERHFREIETNALKTVIQDFPNYIIATGGGTPVFHNNMEIMKEAGLTVYLDASIEVLAERLKTEIEKRPLLKAKEGQNLNETIKSLLQPRLAFYMKCHIAVEIQKSDQEVARIIANYFSSIMYGRKLKKK